MVFRSRWLGLLVVLCLLPGSAAPFLALREGAVPRQPVAPVLLYLPLAVDVVVLALVLALLRGYTVLGAGDRALAGALKRALAGLALPFEESLGALRLPSLAADLSVHTQAGTGSAQLRLEPEDRAAFDRIAGALRAELAAPGPPGGFRAVAFGVFTGAGVLLLGVALLVARLR